MWQSTPYNSIKNLLSFSHLLATHFTSYKKISFCRKIFILRLFGVFEIYLAIDSYGRKKLCAFPQTDSIILSDDVGEKMSKIHTR